MANLGLIAFVTLNISILSGRTQEVKNMIPNKCMALLEQCFLKSTEELKFSLPVQITEINKESYSRIKSY